MLMTIEKHHNTPQETEATNESALWSSLNDKNSSENLSEALFNAMQKINFEPHTYYLESTSTGVSVKNRIDNSILYFTDAPEEVEVLIKAIGLNPAPVPKNQLN